MLTVFSCQTGESDPLRQQLAKIKSLEDLTKVSYRQMSGEEVILEEAQFTQIEQLGDMHYRSLELTNVFHSPNGNDSWTVMEMDLNLQDLKGRQEIRSYEIIEEGDSIRLADADYMEVKLAGVISFPIDGKDESIYRFFGYAHIGDPQPGHIKYWHPHFGTIMMSFGNDLRFEMTDPGDLGDAQLLNKLNFLIREIDKKGS
ncbi:MAG: hypothetical protein AAF206_22665 [Bacteroidota bacterium]